MTNQIRKRGPYYIHPQGEYRPVTADRLAPWSGMPVRTETVGYIASIRINDKKLGVVGVYGKMPLQDGPLIPVDGDREREIIFAVTGAPELRLEMENDVYREVSSGLFTREWKTNDQALVDDQEATMAKIRRERGR